MRCDDSAVRRRLGWQPSPVTALALAVALALAGNLATGTVQVSSEWWPWVAWLTVVVLFVLSALIGLARSHFDADAIAPGEVVERAAAALAEQVRDQWVDEAVLRQVLQPLPLRVRWSSTSRPVGAARDVVFDQHVAGADWQQLPLEGDASQIVTAFRQLPHRQLVVLGEAGAGKTILTMLLTIGLIKDPEPGQAVPVLLSIASWNPTRESAREFVIRRVAEEYEFLAKRQIKGQSLAERILAQGRILPVLDGLDELPTGWQVSAVESLDDFAAGYRPLVVTCRGREYEHAVTGSGSVLSRAAVVEIEPVKVEQAIAFLSHPAPARPRWRPVFEYLYEFPQGPLAQVLSSPLMVALARIAYRSPTTHPAKLLELADSTLIAGSLIDGFVTSVYQVNQPNPPVARSRRLRAYSPDRAARWLGCLAYHLYLTGTRDLWWWQLRPGLLSRRPALADSLIPVVATAIAVAAVGLAAGLLFGIQSAIWSSVATTVAIGTSASGVFRSLWPGGYPPYTVPWRQTSSSRISARMAFGAVFGVMAGLIMNDPLLGFEGGAACGLVVIVMPTLSLPSQARRSTPLTTVRANRRNVVAAGMQYGLVGGIVFAATTPLDPRAPTALVAACTAGLVYAVAAGYGAGLWTWTQFRLAHALLATQGWLPWRLWMFLEDGHRRGALRQAGTAWQFRHVLLQDHLARQISQAHLRSRADGDSRAARQLAELLAGQGSARGGNRDPPAPRPQPVRRPGTGRAARPAGPPRRGNRNLAALRPEPLRLSGAGRVARPAGPPRRGNRDPAGPRRRPCSGPQHERR
jgi:hypothetical protein